MLLAELVQEMLIGGRETAAPIDGEGEINAVI